MQEKRDAELIIWPAVKASISFDLSPIEARNFNQSPTNPCKIHSLKSAQGAQADGTYSKTASVGNGYVVAWEPKASKAQSELLLSRQACSPAPESTIESTNCRALMSFNQSGSRQARSPAKHQPKLKSKQLSCGEEVCIVEQDIQTMLLR